MSTPSANPSPQRPIGGLAASAHPGGRPAPTDTTPEGEALLRKNLELLSQRSSAAVRAIHAAGSADHLHFLHDDHGRWCARITDRGIARQACSFRDAAAEARAWAKKIDVTTAAAIVVRGFGCGHHIAALAAKMRHLGTIIIYEPDTALLREMLRRINLVECFGSSHVVLVTDPADASALAAGIAGLEGTLAAGLCVVDHPPSIARIGPTAEQFGQSLAHIVKAVRTNVVTTLVHSDVTARNCIQNLGTYVTVPGIQDLANVCAGHPAVVVSAGPSLRRNIALLSEPGIRDRVVIIAVQTTLKTLLARGIKPHFVVALDYHEISRRFYEGLTEADVEGVTLVAEPKCNPAILQSFPGVIRCAGDDVSDRVAGERLSRDMGRIRPGSTVAHLAYYLARHLGCDPVIMIGQDLGFTDHQYYAPGAAIHETWAGELSEFNTLEMLEWQRIARMRLLLRPVQDQEGRRIYTDEQMATYLVHFERDFARDAAAGLTIIDATQGGVAKAHTTVRTLRDALDAYATRPLPAIPAGTLSAQSGNRREAARERLMELSRAAAELTRMGRESQTLLKRMIDQPHDRQTVNTLIARVQAFGERAAANPAYWLVQFINQTGQLKRFRADRALDLNTELSASERQLGQMERDLENVRWLTDAAEHLGTLLVQGLETLSGKPPVTRDPSVSDDATLRVTREQRRIIAAVPLLDRCASLPTTLRRLSRCDTISQTVLLVPPDSTAMDQAHQLAASLPRVSIHACQNGNAMRERSRRVAHGRAWSRHAWRGGIANLTMFDEAYHPSQIGAAMREQNADAAALIGPDWSWIDPALIDAAAIRYLERPDTYGITFTQAAPGLGTCILARRVVEEAAAVMGSHASIGGLLGYVPVAPQADPITKPVCPAIDPLIRDCPMRCTADESDIVALLQSFPADGPALEIARRISAWFDELDPGRYPGQTVELLVDHGTLPQAVAQWLSRQPMLPRSLTLRGAGHNAPVLADAAHACGVGTIHVRTSLFGGEEEARALLDSRAAVISIDLVADEARTYESLTGRGDYDLIRSGVEVLVNEARRDESAGAGMPSRWIVPRITRCDAVLDEIERFHDRWLLFAGACVIDAPPQSMSGPRIEALPLPRLARRRLELLHRTMDLRHGVITEPPARRTMEVGA